MTETSTHSRRKLLSAVGIGGITAVTGCLGEESSPDNSTQKQGDDASEDTGGTDTADGDEGTADTAGQEDGEDDTSGTEDGSGTETNEKAEQAVENYLGGIDEGDIETANQFAHPDGDQTIREGDIEEPGVTIHELRTASLREVVEKRTDSEGETLESELSDAEQTHRDLLSEIGASDYAYVRISITSAQYGDEEGYLLVVLTDGEWLVWGTPP
ncbi:MAG: hypothetical protein V5A36_07285 [Natronomonas sp.]